MIVDLQLFTERAVIALVLGTLIGVERQLRQCMTGLRTNALVSLGAAIFVMSCGFDSAVIVHQGRVIAQIVSGIGFVGAGVIMKDGAKVRGLSTAVTLWCSSAIGCLCGVGEPLIAFVGTTLILCANIILKKISRRINMYLVYKQSQQQSQVIHQGADGSDHTETETIISLDEEEYHYQLSIVCRKREEGQVRRLVMSMLNGVPLMLRSLNTEADERDSTRVEVNADLIAYSPQQTQLEQIVSRISIERSVSAVSWRVSSNTEEG